MKFEWDINKEKINIQKHIYLDEEIKNFLMKNIKNKNFSLNRIINSLIKQNIDISKKIAHQI